MQKTALSQIINGLDYPDSGIIAGRSSDGCSALTAFFICGNDIYSRDRVFVEDGGGVNILPFSGMLGSGEPQLIYQPILAFENKLLVGNGSHVEHLFNAYAEEGFINDAMTKLDCIESGGCEFPRITLLMDAADDSLKLKMHIAKRLGECVLRQTFDYENVEPGMGFYMGALSADGSGIGHYSGEPVPVELDGSIFDMVADVWENLKAETRVSLWVRSMDLKTRKSISRIINRNR